MNKLNRFITPELREKRKERKNETEKIKNQFSNFLEFVLEFFRQFSLPDTFHMHISLVKKANDISFTASASSWVIPENGVPLTSSIVSPGRRPERSATELSSIREMYTPMPVEEGND